MRVRKRGSSSSFDGCDQVMLWLQAGVGSNDHSVVGSSAAQGSRSLEFWMTFIVAFCPLHPGGLQL